MLGDLYLLTHAVIISLRRILTLSHVLYLFVQCLLIVHFQFRHSVSDACRFEFLELPGLQFGLEHFIDLFKRSAFEFRSEEYSKESREVGRGGENPPDFGAQVWAGFREEVRGGKGDQKRCEDVVGGAESHDLFPHPHPTDLGPDQKGIVAGGNLGEEAEKDEGGNDGPPLVGVLVGLGAESGADGQEDATHEPTSDHQWASAGVVSRQDTRECSDDGHGLANGGVGEGSVAVPGLFVKRRTITVDKLIAVGLLKYEQARHDPRPSAIVGRVAENLPPSARVHGAILGDGVLDGVNLGGNVATGDFFLCAELFEVPERELLLAFEQEPSGGFGSECDQTQNNDGGDELHGARNEPAPVRRLLDKGSRHSSSPEIAQGDDEGDGTGQQSTK